MPRSARRRLAALVALALVAGCDSRLVPTAALSSSTDTPGERLAISPSTVTVRVGGETQLRVDGPASLLPASFSSSRPLVALVSSDGRVVGLSVGTAVILAVSSRDLDAFASAVVHVVE